MSRAIKPIIIFSLGLFIAFVLVFSVRVHWEWILLLPAALIFYIAYKNLSEHPHLSRDDTPLIGAKGGTSYRGEGYHEDSDEEE